MSELDYLAAEPEDPDHAEQTEIIEPVADEDVVEVSADDIEDDYVAEEAE